MPLVLVHGSTRTPLDRDLSVGSAPSCELSLENAKPRHARVEARGDRIVIRPEGDAVVLVGEVAVEAGGERWLLVGDTVTIGETALTVEMDETDVPLRTAELALAIVRRLRTDRAPIVHVVEGPDLGAELVLANEGRAHRIGRAARCALVLSDPAVSREHVRVTAKAGAVFVADMEAPRGTFLGRDRLVPGADATWVSTKCVRIGKTVLRVTLPDPEGRLEQLAQAMVPAEPAVEPPIDPPPAEPEAPRSHPIAATAAPIVEAPAAEAPVRRESKKAPSPWLFRAGIGLVFVTAAALLYWIMR